MEPVFVRQTCRMSDPTEEFAHIVVGIGEAPEPVGIAEFVLHDTEFGAEGVVSSTHVADEPAEFSV